MRFEEILQELNIPFRRVGEHHHCRVGWLNIDCPFCGRDSHKWHMGYCIDRNYFTCWRCGGHPIIKALMEASGRPYHEIKNLLQGFVFERFDEKPKVQGVLKLPIGIKPLHSAHKKYLKERGFNWRKIERLWQVKGIGIASRLAWRIFIPVHYQGEVVSWATRAISDLTLRYISASEEEESIPHKELLYGEDFAHLTIIVVEGFFDVWRIGPGAVCTFGSGYSSEQMKKIAKYPTRVICFDNEPEAQKRAKRLANELSVLPGETYNVTLDSKDPAVEPYENILRLRKEFLE